MKYAEILAMWDVKPDQLRAELKVREKPVEEPEPPAPPEPTSVVDAGGVAVPCPVVPVENPHITTTPDGYRIDWKALWKEYCLYAMTAKNTNREDWRNVSNFLVWLNGRPFTGREVMAYGRHLAAKGSALYSAVATRSVARVTAYMVERGYMKHDPCAAIKHVRCSQRDPLPGYSHEDYLKMRDGIKDENARRYVIIAWHTGMSMIDVCKLMWGEVDLKAMMIRRMRHKMTKRTGSTQRIPIIAGSDLHRLLLQLSAERHGESPTEQVSPMLSGHYLNMDNRKEGTAMRELLEKHVRRAGVVYRGTHGFRRTLISVLVNRDGDTPVNLVHASQVSGHRSIEMLKRYTIPKDEAIRRSMGGAMAEHFRLSMQGGADPGGKAQDSGENTAEVVTVDWSKVA